MSFRLIEPLETRRLLATYNLADYYPAFAGATWKERGSIESTGVEDTTTIARAKLGSTSVFRADEKIITGFGNVSTASTYFTINSAGMDLYHMESVGGVTSSDDGSLIFDFKSPFHYLNGTLVDGAKTISPKVQATAVITSPDGDFHGSGVVWGDQIVLPPRDIPLPDGRFAFHAVTVKIGMSFEFIGTLNNRNLTVRGDAVETVYLVRGFGPVGHDEEVKLTVSEGPNSSKSGVRGSLLLESSNLQRPPATISFASGALTVTGTSGPDDIGLMLVNGSLYVVSNGFTVAPNGVTDRYKNIFSTTAVKSISVAAGEGNDWINIDTPLQAGATPSPLAGGYIDAGPGDDRITAGYASDTLTGGAGKDTIDGGPGHDRINGNGSHDRLSGGDGDDRIYGGDGNDVIEGGTGTDRVWAGAGDDILAGNGSNDKLLGEAGNDLLKGNQGADLLDGGDDIDTAISDALDTLLQIET